MDKIGEKIKKSREKCGYSITQVANAVNILPLTLKAIENGSYFPAYQTISKILEFLHESPEQILADMKNSELQDIYYRIIDKLKNLTPKQLTAAEDILDAYIKNLR